MMYVCGSIHFFFQSQATTIAWLIMSEIRLRDNIVVLFSTRLKAFFFLFRCHILHMYKCSLFDILGRSISTISNISSIFFVYLDERNNLYIHIYLNHYQGSTSLHQGTTWYLPDFSFLCSRCNNKSRTYVQTKQC
jgi:hypothetical protein